METELILSYFSQNWDKVQELAKRQGLERGFYPVILPETEGLRLVDPTLPSLNGELYRLTQARITNPSTCQFEGLVLEEKVNLEMEEGTKLVTVTYLQRGEIQVIQCLKDSKNDFLCRYLAVSLVTKAEQLPLDELRKVYNELEPLLHEKR